MAFLCGFPAYQARMDSDRRHQPGEGRPPNPNAPNAFPALDGGGMGGMDPAVAIVVVALVAVVAVLAPVFGMHMGVVHQIPEGHVGVYWRGGALLRTITEPGYHTLIPFITTYDVIQVTLQTDQVTNIPCGTKGGVMIYFDKIEVVNRLKHDYVHDTIKQYGVNYDRTWIYDKIHHEINQFCSAHSLQQVYIDLFDQIDEKVRDAIMKDLDRYAPGIEVIGVRVTKPKIPAVIARNYEQMEEERTKVLIAMERQQVVGKEAETERKRAVNEAEMAAQVSGILMSQRVAEQESHQRQQQIENEIFLAREKALADAQHYRLEREATANAALLTPSFLELQFIRAMGNNTKMFFGDKIPSIMDHRLLSHWSGAQMQETDQ